ncbi:hypothetical protein BC829DRAFT_420787 [Chytridium lagenaria]|nr:hypothetical protein BC829DRAFT_420787 [Chytridium lagenaria]
MKKSAFPKYSGCGLNGWGELFKFKFFVRNCMMVSSDDEASVTEPSKRPDDDYPTRKKHSLWIGWLLRKAFGGQSIREFARENDVHHSSLIRWQKKEDAIRDGKGNSMTLHKGRRRFGHEQGHVQFILDQVENKIQLQEYCSVAYLAFALAHRDPSFSPHLHETPFQITIKKTFPSRKKVLFQNVMRWQHWVGWWYIGGVGALRISGEVLRKHSRICNWSSGLTVDEKRIFGWMYCVFVEDFNISPDRVGNMDQTNVPFDIIHKTTMAKKGARTVSLRLPKKQGTPHNVSWNTNGGFWEGKRWTHCQGVW